MIAPNTLLRIIARLQRDISVEHGRHLLLDFLRKSTSARLCLLFSLDSQKQELVYLDHSGRRPPMHQRAAAPEAPDPSGKPGRQRKSTRAFETERIPLEGVFGTALRAAEPLYIPTIYQDTRSLRVEQYWIRSTDRVLLCAVRLHEARQGLLILCWAPPSADAEGVTLMEIQELPSDPSFQVCITLLSTYLSPTTDRQLVSATPPNSHGRVLKSTREPSEEEASQSEQRAFDDLLVALSAEREAINEERGRLARDMHDGIAQELVHVLHRLEFVQRVFDQQPQLVLHEIAQIERILRTSLENLRSDISALIATRVQEHGFREVLRGLLEDFNRNEPEIQVSCALEALDSVPTVLEVTIFRVIQEALSNIQKHAQATAVSIRVSCQAGLLLVVVSDNGSGGAGSVADSGSGPQIRHFGLRIMRERVRQARGVVEVQLRPGLGTTVTARFPLTRLALRLTRREREVLSLLAEGATNRLIAESLSVSVETIKSHVHHIMQKMQVRDRTEAAVVATRQRWL